MNSKSRPPHFAILRFLGRGAVAIFAVASLQAQTLFLDFGPTPTSSPSNSPHHSTTPGAGTSWNRIQNADVNSGLFFSDGSAATGVAVNVGAGSYASIDFGTNPTGNNALGGVVNHGVFAGSSVGKDGIFHGSGSPTFTQSGVAVQISGLAAGTYDIYVVAVNTNSGASFDLRQRVGATASGAVASFTPAPIVDISNAGAGASLDATPTGYSVAWSEGLNYARLSVSITAGQNLIVYSLGIPTVAGGPTEETRGFLNAIQLVHTTVPEPGAFAAAAGLAGLAAAGFPRRRRGGAGL